MGRSEKELAHYTHVRDEHAMTISAHVKGWEIWAGGSVDGDEHLQVDDHARLWVVGERFFIVSFSLIICFPLLDSLLVLFLLGALPFSCSLTWIRARRRSRGGNRSTH
jgi:hypothetical protein